MPTRNVVLTDRQSRMIDELVEQGVYQNASEVLREGLRLVEARRQREADYSAWLRKEAQVGIDAMERGDYISLDSDEAIKSYMQDAFDRALARAGKAK